MEKSVEAMPAYALCYLVNGDPTGLTDDEIQMIDDRNYLETTAQF